MGSHTEGGEAGTELVSSRLENVTCRSCVQAGALNTWELLVSRTLERGLPGGQTWVTSGEDEHVPGMRNAAKHPDQKLASTRETTSTVAKSLSELKKHNVPGRIAQEYGVPGVPSKCGSLNYTWAGLLKFSEDMFRAKWLTEWQCVPETRNVASKRHSLKICKTWGGNVFNDDVWSSSPKNAAAFGKEIVKSFNALVLFSSPEHICMFQQCAGHISQSLQPKDLNARPLI